LIKRDSKIFQFKKIAFILNLSNNPQNPQKLSSTTVFNLDNNNNKKKNKKKFLEHQISILE